MPYAKIDGLDLYYELHGDSGEPLVLIHGYTGDITDWRHQLPEYSRDYRVLIIDNRGHGKSEATPDRSAYTVDRMADDAEALVELAGLDRYHLLGHSMGGAIAQEIALRSPDRLLSLTLHSTAHKFEVGGNAAVAAWIEYRHDVAEKQGMRAVANLQAPFPPPPHMPAERLEETKERLARMSVDAFIGGWQGLVQWAGTEDRASDIDLPTLVIYGDMDTPPILQGCQTLGSLIPNARLEVVPQTGHSPQWERPELFNAALSSHLAASAASQRPGLAAAG